MSSGGAAIFVLALWILPIFVGGWVAVGRRRSAWVGLLFGFFLGWLGVAACLFLPSGVPPRRYRRRRL